MNSQIKKINLSRIFGIKCQNRHKICIRVELQKNMEFLIHLVNSFHLFWTTFKELSVIKMNQKLLNKYYFHSDTKHFRFHFLIR